MLRSKVLVVALVLGLLALAPAALAADSTHEGIVVKAENGMLTMKDKDGASQHVHKIPATAEITCDGKKCELKDLKAGFQVKVTTKDDAQQTVIRVEAKKNSQ